MTRWLVLCALFGAGCVEGVTQVAGTGAIYTTRCSGDMDAQGGTYVARCTPPSCAARFTAVAENHVVVALDPGRKVVGYRERVCLQDLSAASALFTPPIDPEATTAPEAAETPEI